MLTYVEWLKMHEEMCDFCRKGRGKMSRHHQRELLSVYHDVLREERRAKAEAEGRGRCPYLCGHVGACEDAREKRRD